MRREKSGLCLGSLSQHIAIIAYLKTIQATVVSTVYMSTVYMMFWTLHVITARRIVRLVHSVAIPQKLIQGARVKARVRLDSTAEHFPACHSK